MPKSAEIQDQINAKNAEIDAEAQKAESTDHGKIIQLRNEISILEMQLSDAKAEEAQQIERVQAQTEKVESITLPLDFNDLLDNPLANEMIIEVVKQFQLQAYDEHNAEVVRIHADWQSKLSAANQIESDQKARIIELQAEFESEKGARIMFENAASFEKDRADQLEHDLHMANLDKDQALMYRDNAVAQLGERQDVINSQAETILGLQQELSAKKALTVNGNDKLAELASKAKESTIEKANRGLARWNLPAIEVPSMPSAESLETPAIPEITALPEVHPTDEVQTAASEGNSTVEGNTAIPQSLGERTAAEETLTLESLKAEIDALKTAHDTTVVRVDNIERHANIQAVA
jgi:hypothetical protein